MNILIIGGLLVLALVAIVGAVLLGIGEDRAEKQRAAESVASLKQESEAPQVADQVSEALQVADQVSEAPQASEATLPPPTLPSPMPEIPTSSPSGNLRTTRQLAPSLHKIELLPASQNDQLPDHLSHEEETTELLRNELHAMTGELRLLVQKASEMEQRLSQLSDILERQPHPQSGVTASRPLPGIERRE